uniref:Uncharacterized protein LOC117346032 n=1 Tax=Geotrypetes seraphini TaxID=260995 RepID=A0A6P8P829_GEOSA|nr:uncharacterized protein LOC117346032 [Geotrypetes seraphini]
MELVLLTLLCAFPLARSQDDVIYSTLRQSILFTCDNQASAPILWGFSRPGFEPPALVPSSPESLLATSLSDKRNRVEVLSNNALQLHDLQPQDAGIYTCVQHNSPADQPVLKQVTLILLTVQMSPRGPVGEDSEIFMRCSMTCDLDERQCSRNPQGAEVSWTDSSGQLIGNQTGRYSIQSRGTFSNLKVTVQQSDHRRKWKCGLSVNTETKAVQEVVIPVRGSLLMLFVAEGLPLQLPCVDPSLLKEGERLEWGYRRIGDSESHPISVVPASGPPSCSRCGADLILLPNSTLLLSSVKAADAGSFHCLEFNASGSSSLVQSFRLGVLSVVEEVVTNTSDVLQNSSGIILTCSVRYNLNLNNVSLAWFDNQGKPLTPGTEERVQVTQTSTGLQLVIQVLQVTDFIGAWRCSLSAEGKEQTSFQYHIRTKDAQTSEAQGLRSAVPTLILILLSVQGFFHSW